MQIKDGKRHQYDSGALRSNRTGRGRYDLISPHALLRLAIQYEIGGQQKGDRNWEQGFPCSRAICSAIGHLMQQLAGDRSEDHYAATAWQVFCAMHFEEEIERGRLPVLLNDVPFDASTLPPDTGAAGIEFYVTKETITHVHFNVLVSDGSAGKLYMLRDEFEQLIKRLSGLVKVKDYKGVEGEQPVSLVPEVTTWDDWFAQVNDLSSIQATTGAWAEEHFPGMTNEAIWEHLQREVKELSYEFSPVEAADCFLILLHLAYKNKFNLLAEALKKYKINTERKWATEPDEQGVYLHIDDLKQQLEEMDGGTRHPLDRKVKENDGT